MRFLKVAAWAAQAAAVLNQFRVIEHPDPDRRRQLQNIVTWDDKSLFIHGERIMIFAGEFHPFRTPVPSLWLDVLQKVKALGLNTVSFYVHWGLLEGKPGDYSAKGIFALESFFEAAKQAGVYLIARPGPYINAEATGGGFPGWLQRVNGTLRTSDKEYLDATENYMANIAKTIAAAQITNGGPVILYQPENEYTNGDGVPDGAYFEYVMDQARRAGIVVPMISNDQSVQGNNAPGTGIGAADIYGHDAYYWGPLDCATPNVWPAPKISTNFRELHEQISPTTPYSIVEFQAGCWMHWGRITYDDCAALLNEEYERVYYKNTLGFGTGIFGLYMIAGGTNWGNLGFPDGITSYDYAAAIREDRRIDRKKYSELKLIANFMKVTPSYLEAGPKPLTRAVYTDTDALVVTPMFLPNSTSAFYVVRHANEASTAVTSYKLKVKTSAGDLVLPQTQGSLTLNGRDSKIHIVDYDVGGINLVYSTAEVLTWKKFHDRTVLLLYGGAGERHEIGLQADTADLIEGSAESLSLKAIDGFASVSWVVSSGRTVVRVGGLEIYLLDRDSAYMYWVPELSSGFSTKNRTAASIIVRGPYLVRGASVSGDQLHITADFIDGGDELEVIGAPKDAKSLYISGKEVTHTTDKSGNWKASAGFTKPTYTLPDLENLTWKYYDSLPEIRSDFDDSAWPKADLAETHNPRYPLKTPVSLYGSDYGFHAGALVFRGTFTASGNESELSLTTQGGGGFGFSVWLNSTYVGSWVGQYAEQDKSNKVTTHKLPALEEGRRYTLTIVLDNHGLEQNGYVGSDSMKTPRGIIEYGLRDAAGGGATPAVAWRLTGNLGGESRRDQSRGPLNEGGLHAERQGFHLPRPPSSGWEARSPVSSGVHSAGVGFFAASFALDLPEGYDTPLYFSFANSTSPPAPYRALLYVNGFQFGRLVGHLGPQAAFHVPEGVLNYRGENWVAVSLWAQRAEGARLDGLKLTAGPPVMTGYGGVTLVDAPAWERREGAY